MSTNTEFTDFAIHLAEIAGAQILPHFRTDLGIENKGARDRFDPVTIADRDAEAAIRREIKRVYPKHSILGEEHGFEQGESSYTWVIDPIDGTRSFILGQLHWGTLVALNDGSRPIVGVMRQPYTDETFVGSPDGAELRRSGTRLKLAARKSVRLADAYVCATDPSMFVVPADKEAFDRVVARARALRYGGDCYTPCLIAAGCADLVVETGLKPWDVQAIVPIIEAAGGVITDWSGGRADQADNVVIAAARELHAEVIEALSWQRGG